MTGVERLIIARGRTAEVLAWEDGQVLKLFNDGMPADLIEREVRAARLVSAADLPTPKLLGEQTLNGRRRLAFPRPPQLFHFHLQALQQLLQSQIVDLQPLVVGSLPHQFQLQFGDPLVSCTGLTRFVPCATHPSKFTAFRSLRLESFALRFSEF